MAHPRPAHPFRDRCPPEATPGALTVDGRDHGPGENGALPAAGAGASPRKLPGTVPFALEPVHDIDTFWPANTGMDR